MITVCVAGGFDPVHRGHLDHIRKAKALGDKLIVITHPDAILIAKKGYCFMPLTDRKEILEGLRWVDKVVISIDGDGTVAKTLAMIKQNIKGDLIFAKGGDRNPNNMPQNEIDICKELGIELVYGIGDKINSSSEIIAKACAETVSQWLKQNMPSNPYFYRLTKIGIKQAEAYKQAQLAILKQFDTF